MGGPPAEQLSKLLFYITFKQRAFRRGSLQPPGEYGHASLQANRGTAGFHSRSYVFIKQRSAPQGDHPGLAFQHLYQCFLLKATKASFSPGGK